MSLTDFIPKAPSIDGSSTERKAYALWLLTNEVTKAFSFKENHVPYSPTEISLFVSFFVLWEFRLIASQVDNSTSIIEHYLKFPAYEIAKIRRNKMFEVKRDWPIGSWREQAEYSKQKDRLLSAISDVEVFIKTRDYYYSKQLQDFFSQNRRLPYASIYIAYYAPLTHLGMLDPAEDFSTKVNTRLVDIVAQKLDFLHDELLYQQFVQILLIE